MELASTVPKPWSVDRRRKLALSAALRCLERHQCTAWGRPRWPISSAACGAASTAVPASSPTLGVGGETWIKRELAAL